MLKKILIGATFLSLVSLTVSNRICAQEEDLSSVVGEVTAALTRYCTNLKNDLSTVPSLKDVLPTMLCGKDQEVVPLSLVGLISMENEEILKSIHNIQEELNYLDGFCAGDAENEGCKSFLLQKSVLGISADTPLDFAKHLKNEAAKLDATVLAIDIQQNFKKQQELAVIAARGTTSPLLSGGKEVVRLTSLGVGVLNNNVGVVQLGITAWRMGPDGGLFTPPGALLGADVLVGAGYGYFVAPWVKNKIQTYLGYSEFIADRLTYGIKDFVLGAGIAWYLEEGIELYSSLSSSHGKKAAIINPVAWGLLTALGNGLAATVFDYLEEGPAKENTTNNDL